ncbi:PepSY-associated TM helix domain-containing protein [Variovorax arabinosiphilus]|uniref:PepSY-associated TM helix domain-containing protein n=1 Tax=Variovorax arabinosiphilus TaxID=3053498 RepID=UPI00257875F9|nr:MULTISPECIES: PepSY-associated TM helix domain-containing protein [unclassified Variovorax]MDM0120617.1 PepSY-associated TM helix domain-containing protein [Variovorax sp. J2L1-78]MDM0127471.1 PepSY-associated TM helix domain-containing protein [Variovorax sp. J2L1-63]MDM0231170.1 PepSY-associated TM helix domain-containing protein [Variovorax sp. J2R1-6]
MSIGAEPHPRGIRQTMSDLHIWAGLLTGWFLYAMFLTGTVSYFKDELSQWMRPELQHQAEVPDPAGVARRIVDELQVIAPGSTQWSVGVPDARNNVANAFWRVPGAEGRRAFQSATFDPTTGHKVSSRETAGGDFFYRFHFQFHYMPVLWGRWLAGFCAMFMLVAIVSGVITHKKIFVDFFTFRWGKGQRSWLDAHNALSVFGLPFHAMITYTGLVTLMALYMPWGSQTAFKTPAERQQLIAELSAFIQPGKPSGQKAALAPVEDMVRQAQARWGHDNINRVTITHGGDAAARVSVSRGDQGRASVSPQYMLFEGSTGQLLETKDHVGPAAETRGVMYALHLGRFGDTVTRWLYFIVSLAGTAMVGTGLVMWTVKRRQKLPNPDKPYFGFRVVERLNIAAIAGLSIAMAGMLWANRLLPTDLPDRAAWEIHTFFIVWGLMCVHAVLRPAKRAWLEQLWLATAALALLPLVNVFTTQRPLWRSLAEGDWVFAGVDGMLWALAALHAMLAIRTARHSAKVRPARRATPLRPTPSSAGERA